VYERSDVLVVVVVPNTGAAKYISTVLPGPLLDRSGHNLHQFKFSMSSSS
jgi:hypothetical protein